jgi:hypothetical protein
MSGSLNVSGAINLGPSAVFPTVGLFNRTSDTTLYMVAATTGFALLDSSLNSMYGATPTSHIWNISNSEKMRINSSGSVGIGTTSPTTNVGLTVKRPTGTGWIIDALNSSNVRVGGFYSTGGSNGQLYLANSAGTETVILDSAGASYFSGSVGIGITSPSDKLNVVVGSNGNVARFDGPTSGIIFQTNATTTDIISYGGTTPSYRTLNFAAGASTSMAITTAGVVTRPFQPFAMGALSTDQSIPLSTFTVLNFRTDQGFYGVNTNSCWNNSTYTFTAPVTGVYLVNLSLFTNAVGQVALHVNGTRKHSIPSWYVSSSVTWGGSAMIPLTAGEALTLQGYGNAGTLTANVYHTWFAIYLL